MTEECNSGERIDEDTIEAIEQDDEQGPEPGLWDKFMEEEEGEQQEMANEGLDEITRSLMVQSVSEVVRTFCNTIDGNIGERILRRHDYEIYLLLLYNKINSTLVS